LDKRSWPDLLLPSRLCSQGRARQGLDDRDRARPATQRQPEAAYGLLDKASPGLFCKLILIPLLRRHRIQSGPRRPGVNADAPLRQHLRHGGGEVRAYDFSR
jgi:hypothetical protein